MSYILKFSKEASRSIEDQVQWYESDEEHGGVELADRWLHRLETALGKLVQAPHRHGFAPENRRWHTEFEIRQLQFRPWKSGVGWRVLYVIDEPVHTVIVIQVRHERRRRLFEPEED